MKVLVIGRSGQLARSIAERWPEADVAVEVAGRPEIDLEREGEAEAAIAARAPDLVVNAAAYTAVDAAEGEPERAFRVNAEAAGEVARAARSAGARLIHLSTDYVFDGSLSESHGEGSPTAPRSAYGRSKLAGEDSVRSAGGDHLIVRTAWVYSPFGRNFVKTMVTAARDRDSLRVVADQLGNPTSALDLADGLLAAARDWHAGTYHLAGTGTTSWFGLAEAVMDECRRLALPAARVEPIATADWPTPAERPANSVLDCSRFKRDFGFSMPHWRRSLAPVVERIGTGER